MPEGWAGWRLRQEAAGQGCPTNYWQVKAYARCGLIRPYTDGTWPPETVELLCLIKEAAAQAWPLPRRAVLLRRDYLRFPVSDEKLREAMVAMSGPRSIKAPRRKLRQVRRGWEALAPGPPGTLRRSLAALPEPRAWPALLRDKRISDDVFGSQARFAYRLDDQFMASQIGGWPENEVIPVEERILLLMVMNLSAIPPP